MYVCLCSGVTDRDIRQAVQLGASSLNDLRTGLGVGLQCGRCVGMACGLLAEGPAAQLAVVGTERLAEPA